MAGDVYTLKIQVDDKGQPIIKRLRKDLKALGIDVNDVGKKTKKTWTDMFKGQAAFAGLRRVMLTASRTLKTLTGDLVDFDREFQNVTTLLDKGEEVTFNMKEELLDMAGALGSTTELTKALYQTISASVEPAKAIEFVGEAAKFAKAGLTEVATSVDVLTTVLNAYGMEAEEVTHVSDVLFQTVKDGKITGQELASSLGTVIPTAASLGISLEEITAGLATLTKVGIDSRTAVVALNQTLLAVLKPTEQAAKAAEKLGINLSQAGIKAAGGLQPFLADLKDKLNGNNKAMAELFPNVRALKATFNLAGTQAGVFAEEMKKMQDVAGNTQEAFDKQQKSMSAVADAIKNELSAAFQKELLPVLNSFKDWVINNKDEIIASFTSIIKAAGDAVKFVGEAYFELSGMRARGNEAMAAGAAKSLKETNETIIKSLKEMGIATDEQVDKLIEMSKSIKDVRVEAKGFSIGFKDLKVQSKELERQAKLHELLGKTYGTNIQKVDKLRIARAMLKKAIEDNTKAGYENVTLSEEQAEVTRILEARLALLNQTGNKTVTVEEQLAKETKSANAQFKLSADFLGGFGNILEDFGLNIDDATESYNNLSLENKEFEGSLKDTMTTAQAAALFISGDFVGALNLLAKGFTDIKTKTKESKGFFKDFKEGFDDLNMLEKVNLISNAFSQLGIDADSGFGQVLKGAQSIARIATGDILGGAAGLVSTLFGGFFDGSRKREKELIKRNKTIINAQQANASALLTFEQAERLVDGTADLSELISENFNEMFANIGEGTDDLIDFANGLVEAGVNITDIFEEVSDKLKNVNEEIKGIRESGLNLAVEGLKDLPLGALSDKFRGTIVAALQAGGKSAQEIVELLGKQAPAAMRIFVEENENALNKIDALNKVMTGLGRAGELTAEQFRTMQNQAFNLRQQLIDNGASEEESLRAILPLLARQKFLADEYGFALTENQKKLIAEAEAKGFNLSGFIDAEDRQLLLLEKQADLLQQLVDIFARILPKAMQKTADANEKMFNRMSDNQDNFTEGGGFGGFGPAPGEEDAGRPHDGPGFAKGGSFKIPAGHPNDTFPVRFRAKSKETVTITPEGQSGGKTVNLYLTVNGANMTMEEISRSVLRDIDMGKYESKEILDRAGA